MDQQANFDLVQDKLISAPILALPNFDLVFEVETDASCTGIGAMLTQQGKVIELFNEKLSEARRKSSTYEQEFYVVVRSLKHWEHHLVHKVFTLFCDHKSLQFLNSQKNLSNMHFVLTKV